MPTVTVSDENKKRIENLRKDMPFINGKVPSVKAVVELTLEYVAENNAEFMEWIEKRGNQKR